MEKEKIEQKGIYPFSLKKEDVWGVYDVENNKVVSKGMIVSKQGEKCPVFNDVLPYKSVTMVCGINQLEEVTYWIEYVQGANCISDLKEMPGDNIAIRSNYTCW